MQYKEAGEQYLKRCVETLNDERSIRIVYEEKLKETAQVHENMEKEISKKDEKIKEAQSLYEDSVASAQEEITGLRHMKENLESSLAQLKEKTSKFFENMHILMNDFSK